MLSIIYPHFRILNHIFLEVADYFLRATRRRGAKRHTIKTE